MKFGKIHEEVQLGRYCFMAIECGKADECPSRDSHAIGRPPCFAEKEQQEEETDLDERKQIPLFGEAPHA